MNWLKKNKKTGSIILIVLSLVCILGFSFRNFGESTVPGSAVQQIAATVQGVFGKAGDSISGTFEGIFKFRTIQDENKKLKEENSILRKENTALLLSKAELEELTILSEALNYSGVAERNGLLTAEVIAMDGSNWFNIFTINAGAEAGIENDDVVVNGVGLVGRVMGTGEGWSKVIGIIDESNKVSFKIQRDMNLIGIVQGDGSGGLKGFMLDGKASVIEGDVLITTNIGIYPEGIVIGKISKIEFDNDTQLKNVTITPEVDFKSIQKVAVIR